MVGSGGTDRSKEAVGMMALHEALRTVCLNSDWTYSVFWTIRPRPRVRGGNGCKVGDDNGSLMLMWEDGFCRGRSVADCLDHHHHEMDGEDLVRKSFSKMSIQLYNYGEGLMGKVASDKCHKWVFKEPTECEPNISNYWQSSFDALPQEWTEQFESGIQTIAVIQAGHGLLQLGSCKIIPEDLHFVLRMRHTFESLGYQSGFYLSQLFSSTRTNTSSPSTLPLKQPPQSLPLRGQPPPPLFNWGPRQPGPSAGPTMLSSPNFQQHSSSSRLIGKDHEAAAHMFLMPHSTEDHHHNNNNYENDIKWPNGLSFFSALTGRPDEAKLLFNPDGKTDPGQDMHGGGSVDPNHEFLSLDGKMHQEGKYKRSFTLPARMATSSSSSSLNHQGHNSNSNNNNNNQGEYRNDSGMYNDVMENFLE
ncbi:hypothetical protein ACP275_08G192500 [Erythranthe tilingii]